MIGPSGEGLTFLLATPRSGATLLGAILGSHSEIACPPEPWFLLPLLALRDARPAVVAAYDHDLARHATRDFLDDCRFVDAARAFATTAYTAHLRREGKCLFVDKCGRYYQVLRDLRALFPAAAHIWLQRNPLDVIASYGTTWGVGVADLFAPLVSPNSFDVTVSYSMLAEHFSQHGATFTLKYEDLVTRPAEIVPSLCSALNVSFEDAMLRYVDNAALMTTYRRSDFGDKKLHQETSVHARSVGSWRDALTRAEVKSVLGVLGRLPFAAMGYDEALAEALAFAGMDEAELTPRGRLDAYERALAEYPAGNVRTLRANPSLWPQAGGRTSQIELELVFQTLIEEKEAAIQTASWNLTRRQDEIEALHRLLREKEAIGAALAEEAAARLEKLDDAHTALAERGEEIEALHRSLREKEAMIQSLAQEAERRRVHLEITSDALREIRQQVGSGSTPNPGRAALGTDPRM